MGTESMSFVDNNQEKLPDHLGFASLTTFTLKRAEVMDEPSGPVGAEIPSDPEITSVPSHYETDSFESITRSLKFKRRPWIVYDQFQSEREADAKQHDMSLSPYICLPKVVIRGCSDCSGCQKVSARWNPAGACTYILKDALVFHPNEEDFKDTIKYIDSIRQQVEPYGFCRIVPPSSWKLPSFFEEDGIWQNYKFATNVQRVNELKNHFSYRKAPKYNDTREAKRRKLDTEITDACAANFSSDECHESDSFQIESGPEFSLIAFKRYADDFQQSYFSREAEVAKDNARSTMRRNQWEPSEQNIEGEFWRIVEKPTEDLRVLYATDAISGDFGCESQSSTNPGQASGSVEGFAQNWDLNSLYMLPGSLLSFERLDYSGIIAPQLHIGMCFSCLPWSIEEHRLSKLQFLHLGAQRIWYGIPASDSHKLEAITKKHFPVSAKENFELLDRPAWQLSPATLNSEGIPVYRCVQRPGEFVLFLPGAYHSGFDCGFNCSVSAVYAPLDWLPHGQISIELYREWRRKTSISYDKLLLRAADEAVKAKWESLVTGSKTSKNLRWKEASGKDGLLAKTLKARIRSEARCRDYLSSASQWKKMDKAFDGVGPKLECSICCCDLYLSAVSCPCSQNRYSCLVHAKYFCSCGWSERIFHFRYQINELNILAEAVEGKLTAIRTWLRENLGQALQWDQNGPFMDISSTAAKANVAPENYEASGSKLLSEAEEHLLEMNSDCVKAKAGKVSRKEASDDTSSSSSSEFDVEEYITRLEESCKSGAFPRASDEGESMPNN